MKKIVETKYQCEGCLIHYDDESAAIRCEEEHRTIMNMKKNYSNTGSYYPESIDITFDDSELICYKKVNIYE